MSNSRFIVLMTGAVLIVVSGIILIWVTNRPGPDPAPLRGTSTPPPSTSSTQAGPVGQSGSWKILFRDEFDTQVLNRGHWTVCYWWDNTGCTNLGNNELEWYLPENVTVRDGALHLTAQKKTVTGSDDATYPYTSGMVTTGPVSSKAGASSARFTFQYGFVEARVRVPKGTGLWPAFWMLPVDMTSKPEIDVMEILGDQTSLNKMHLHYLDASGEEVSPGQDWQGPDLSADWHIYAVDWQPDRVIWYVDGVETWRMEGTSQLLTKREYLLFNLAVGGDWPGDPGPDTVFPATMDIDWVRVWQPVQ